MAETRVRCRRPLMRIRQESQDFLEEYAGVPIAFEVEAILALSVRQAGMSGFELRAEPVGCPYTKDYDAHPGNRPADWPGRFDLSGWGIFSGRRDGELVGGAAVAHDTPGMHMLGDRTDLAVLWDLRVAPDARHQGVGARLFDAAARWAAQRGCRQLVIETQNVNLPACRFYARRGCVLGAIHRFAYPELPDEVQLLWYKELGSGAGASA